MKDKITYQTEEQKEIYKFILVLVILVVIIIGIFFLSKIIIKDEMAPYEYTDGIVNNSIAIAGTILNKKDKEYYLLAYDTTKNTASSYTTYAGYYTSNKENALPIYYLDLSNGFNKSYYVEKDSNPKAQKISDLKMLDGTLIKVTNKKITKYIEGMDKIATELKVPSKN